jgi:deferrochelatase/peroxidase EfeB
LRRLTLRIGLWVAGQLAAHFSRPGYLAETSVIHFARWILLPGTNKLLFMSNFDGTWGRYLEDFIELAASGVTGIWSNTIGFPRTNNLFNDGATDGDRLRRWTRRQQYPTLFWYSAYPKLTLPRIRINAAIRDGIARATTEQEAANWLACFGSSTRPADALQTQEIPSLVFGGLRPLRYGCSLFLQLSTDAEATRAWLSKIAPDLSYGDVLPDKSAVFLAFTASGLDRMGLAKSALERFPVAFQDGNAVPWRSRALGDVGDNAPDNWIWGGPEKAIDAAMLIYARDEGGFESIFKEYEAGLESAGHTIVRRVLFAPVPPKGAKVREPFGFVDGISDPVIRGVGNWTQLKNRNHLVAPGEFVLGYPDELGYLPSSPAVDPGDDPEDLLPTAKPDLLRQRPGIASPAPKDLGCNGTFLVIRQLEQDVPNFRECVERTAALLASRKDPRLPSNDTNVLREWVAAKMVGRWPQDGTSLVRYPHGPGKVEPDNDFLFGSEDPDGLRCPFGAHIRRADPRDSFTPGSAAQLAITNRHRLLRVGRKYDPQRELAKPGLIFMCLNADIERQFEFVQQTWLLAPSFQGLENETDPFLGQHGKGAEVMTFPSPYGPVRISGLRDFVRVKGGGYFFLPGRSAVQWLARSR